MIPVVWRVEVDLTQRLAQRGRELAQRESQHTEELELARRHSQELHALVERAIDAFHASCREAGASHLEVVLSSPRLDDKHFHSVQFDVQRGRYRGIVTVKSRGEVTLVGPFHAGKQEGPCKSFPLDQRSEIEAGLDEFFVEFLDEAFKP